MTILQGMFYMYINKTVIYGQAADIYIFYIHREFCTIEFLLNFLYSLCVPHAICICVFCIVYTQA